MNKQQLKALILKEVKSFLKENKNADPKTLELALPPDVAQSILDFVQGDRFQTIINKPTKKAAMFKKRVPDEALQQLISTVQQNLDGENVFWKELLKAHMTLVKISGMFKTARSLEEEMRDAIQQHPNLVYLFDAWRWRDLTTDPDEE